MTKKVNMKAWYCVGFLAVCSVLLNAYLFGALQSSLWGNKQLTEENIILKDDFNNDNAVFCQAIHDAQLKEDLDWCNKHNSENIQDGLRWKKDFLNCRDKLKYMQLVIDADKVLELRTTGGN